MALYTPFMEKVGSTLGASMARTGRAELAGSAYMGNPNAMQELMRVDPDLGIQIQERKRMSQQRQVQAQAQGDVAAQKKQAAQRKIYMENKDIMDDIFQQASKFENFDEAKSFIQSEFNKNSELLADHADASGFTPEAFQQLKTVFGGTGKNGFKQQEIDIKRETLDLRKLESKSKQEEKKLTRETNDLKRDELLLKIEERRKKIDDKSKKINDAAQNSYDSLNTNIDTIDRLLDHPGLESAVGASSMLPTIPGSDKANFEAELESFDAKIFTNAVKQMRGMGSLSEAEGRKISAAAGAISPKMSEKAFKRNLNIIRAGLEAGKLRLESQGLKPTPVQMAPAQDINTQAMEWAKANPNDPRAAKIMQRLSAQ